MKLGDVLLSSAVRVPDRLAVLCGAERLTFKELNARGNQLANALLARGLGLGDRVVIYMPNSVAVSVVFAACLKAGALLVPVSTRLTAQELGFIIDDCQPFAVMYAEEDAAKVVAATKSTPKALLVDTSGRAVSGGIALAALAAEGGIAEPPKLPFDFQDCMIGYTAGTTGLPKGAIITHANSIFGQYVAATIYGQGDTDVFFATSPMAHRTGFARMVSSYCLGVPLLCQPNFNPAEMATLIEEYGVTQLSIVPTPLRMFLDHLERTDHKLSSIKTIVTGGEACPTDVKLLLKKRLPHARLFLFYGSTEGGTLGALEPDAQFTKDGSSGRPWPGIEIKLIGEDGGEVAPGEAGEIVARSGEPGRFMIFREYYKRPEANAEQIKDGWFRTGDAGRLDEDGYLYIVDRVKDMILSGGLNIYSKEVEHALATAPGVRDVAVCAAPDKEFGEAVAAFVIAKPGETPDKTAIIEHCRERIAGYKKPKHVFVVDEFPRNAVGKVMKADLRAMAKKLLEKVTAVSA